MNLKTERELRIEYEEQAKRLLMSMLGMTDESFRRKIINEQAFRNGYDAIVQLFMSARL